MVNFTGYDIIKEYRITGKFGDLAKLTVDRQIANYKVSVAHLPNRVLAKFSRHTVMNPSASLLHWSQAKQVSN